MTWAKATWAKALELALRTAKGEGPRVAMCPTCPDEVLVLTFHWPGAEFYCLACEGHFSYVDPRPADETPELLERIEAARVAFQQLIDQPGAELETVPKDLEL